MLVHTHVVTSLLAGTLLDKGLELGLGPFYYVGVGLGSLLPDIDHPKSFIGRRSFGIAHLINKLFGHRGVTHSFIFAGGVLGISLLSLPLDWAVGLSVGYCSHILGDFFSVSGVPLLKPFKGKKYKVPVYKTGKLSETIILIISSILLGYATLL